MIYSGNTFNDLGELLVGVQVTLTAPPSDIKVSVITDSNGEWKIEVNDIDNNNVKLTFTQDGRELYIVYKPLPTGRIDRITPQIGGVLDLKGKYVRGTYYVTSLESSTKEDIDKQLEDAYKFVKANPGNYRLFIESSESRVTNYDREPSSPTNGDPLTPTNADPSPLARRRAEALQKYANEFFLNKYNTENPLPEGFILPEVQIKKIETGLTEYNTQEDAVPYGGDPYTSPKGESYKSEQFTRLIAEFIIAPTIIKKIPDPKKCIQNLEIIVKGPTHTCDSAVFKVYLNDILLLRDKDNAPYASMNNWCKGEEIGQRIHGISLEKSLELQQYDNAINGYQSTKGKPGGKRENRFIINDTIANQAIANNSEEMIISMECWNPTNYYEDSSEPTFGGRSIEPGKWGFDCHKGVGEISITNVNGVIQNIPSTTTPQRRDFRTNILSFDPCTLKVIHDSEWFEAQKQARIDALPEGERKKLEKEKKYRSDLKNNNISENEYNRLVAELGINNLDLLFSNF
jgi:hypothetical protein